MSFTDRKLETAILGFAIIMVGGMGYLLKAPVQAALGGQDVVYEMPRPKTSFLASLFDLGGREVSRNYVNPFSKKKEDGKKAVQATKPAQAPAKPAVAQKKKEAPKKSEDPRKGKVDVQVVAAERAKGLGDDGFMADSGSAPQRVENSGKNQNVAEQQQTKNTLSGDQWRALMMAQPSKENMAKLLEAYSKKEVDDQTFYTIVTDLFRSNKVETQALALMAVKSNYSLKSFSVTSQYYDQLTPELQQQAHAYLLNYAVSARLAILMAALQSSDVEVVGTAAQVVLAGYQNAKGGVVSSGDPRNSRGDITVNSISGYSKFIPIFQQLAQSHDSAIVTLANTALSQIQSAVASL
ncbi:MAG: hypothetical protein KUL82_07885 [Bdellovibrio sp.]|nr:hypothetical protein [Bdellovibrio sp.]